MQIENTVKKVNETLLCKLQTSNISELNFLYDKTNIIEIVEFELENNSQFSLQKYIQSFFGTW